MVIQDVKVTRVEGYIYNVGETDFDIRDLATSLPGDFSAGESEQEHRSLLLLAACNGLLVEQVQRLQ